MQSNGAERVYVACDVSNLWKSCRLQHGDNARIDFQVLSELVPSLRHPVSIRQNLFAYIVTNKKQNHRAFYAALRGYGYNIRERFMYYSKGDKPMRTDWDVGLTIDAISKMDDYDTFVLVSGDGDFAQLLRHLRKHKKKTMVLSFDISVSRDLYTGAADEFHTLTKDALFLT